MAPHRTNGRGWRPLSYTQAGALGLLWGAPASATVFHFSLDREGVGAGLAAFFSFHMPMWCATGVFLAWAYVWLSDRVPAIPAAGLALLAATAGHELIVLANPGPVAAILGHPPKPEHIFFFALWNTACLGGLLLAALVIARRQAWRSMLVTYGEIARVRDNARLRHADVQNLRAQLPPSLLMAIVSELRARYATQGPGGDQLLDRLIAFLRAAMPSIRTGGSTFAAELETVRAYADLMAELDPDRGRWSVTASGELPDVRFPPLLLLPALETLAGADPSSALSLTAKEAAGVVTMQARGPGRMDPNVMKDLERRLREGLRQGFGDGGTVSFDGAVDRPALVLSFPAARSDSKPGRTPSASPVTAHILEGESHGP